MMKTIEELIDKANLINDENERLQFVMNYFLETVEYDYSKLLATGYLKENITSLVANGNMPLIKFETPAFSFHDFAMSINGKEEKVKNGNSLYMGVENGLSIMFDSIVTLEHNSKGDIEKFETALFDFFKYEFSKHINNEELILKEAKQLTRKIIKDLKMPVSIRKENLNFIAHRPNVSMVLSCYLAKIKLLPNFQLKKGVEYFPQIIGEDGLLKRGVCEDFSNYLSELLPKVGIEAYRIDGTSELLHSWIVAKVNGVYKSVDLTRAIFIRDRFRGIPENQTASMWLLCDFEDALAMQPTRTITGIDLDENGKSIPIPSVINKDNFNRDEFISLISGMTIKNNHTR